jgi:O-antigen ligase
VKWIIFIVAVLASYPVGHWLRDRPALQLRAWTLIGFLPFFSSTLGMGLIPFGTRAGDTQGIEVALVDWLALSLLFAQKTPARPLPYRFALALYFLVALVSVTQAEWTLGALGYVWKLGRMFLLFAAICRAGHDQRVPAALLRGLMSGIVYEGAWVVWQHYGLKIHQASGTFFHQNSLGILLSLVVMVPVALILAGRASMLPWLTLIAAVPISIFTVSRGTILFFGAGSVLVYIVSTFRTYSLRKAKIGLAGIILGLAILPVALATLGSRSEEAKAESLLVRWRYERAATMMLADHPLGVGANHFTTMLLTGGYGDRAGIDWFNRIGIVHNVYWLTAAEMGYAGVVALAILFLAPILSVLRNGLRAGQDRRADVLLGFGVGLIAFYAHSFFEWAWRITEVSYIYWIAVAIVAILARQIREAVPGRVVPDARRAPSAPAATVSR